MMVLLSLTDMQPPAEVGESTPSPFAALFDPIRAVRDQAVEQAREIMPEVIDLMSRVSGGGARPSKAKMAAGISGALATLTVRGADPKTPFKGPLVVEKRVAWSHLVTLDEIRKIKDELGGTINDILLTAMSGGLRHYLIGRNHTVDGLDLRAAVPVSLRKLDQLADMGNRFGLVFLSLPVGIAEPRARLAELRRRMAVLKRSYEAPVVLGVLHSMGLAPLPVQRLVERIFGTKATAVMTNVPGPRKTLYLGGATIEDFFFWVPQSGRLGLGISILSYAGQVRLGLATDAGLVPDPHGIIDAFHRELDAMRVLAGV
jgi:WS/DGAT/MGAT family acyltransferase